MLPGRAGNDADLQSTLCMLEIWSLESGDVAQMVERALSMREVVGSMPTVSMLDLIRNVTVDPRTAILHAGFGICHVS